MCFLELQVVKVGQAIWKFTLVKWKRRNQIYVECQHEGFQPAIYGTQGCKSFERIDNIYIYI